MFICLQIKVSAIESSCDKLKEYVLCMKKRDQFVLLGDLTLKVGKPSNIVYRHVWRRNAMHCSNLNG